MWGDAAYTGQGKVTEQHAPWTQDFTQHRERAYKYLSQASTRPCEVRTSMRIVATGNALLRLPVDFRCAAELERGGRRAADRPWGRGRHHQVRAYAHAGRPERIHINGLAVNFGERRESVWALPRRSPMGRASKPQLASRDRQR